jgi:cytochrome c biogenesis protein CcmG, thiol:disulfide interchange protein DsbE
VTLTDEPAEAPDTQEPVGGARATSRLAPWIAMAVALAMIGLVVLFVSADPNAPAATPDSPLLGDLAPEAVGELGDGTPFDLSRRKGSFVVLNFFQSDCVPCIREHPELVEFVDQQTQPGANGAEFYSIVTGDTKARVERFFEERGGNWPVVYSPGDRIAAAFGVALVPETWIIDPNGVVQVRIINEVTAEQLSVTIQQLREALG